MYNVSHYLETCINSVIAQELESSSFEVIMIDDESPDGSLQIAKQLQESYSFITVISQKNKGTGGARNTGILNAKGKYLIFLDADDHLLPKSLSPLIEIADLYNLEILEFGAEKMTENGTILNRMRKKDDPSIYDGIEYNQKIRFMNSVCNKLYARNFFIKNDIYFLEQIYGEDFEFNTRVFFYTKRVMATTIIATCFLQSSNSITRNNSKIKKDKYLNDYIKILRNTANFSNKHAITEDEKCFFQERLTLVTINTFYFMFKNNYSFSKMKEVKKILLKENLYYTDSIVSDRDREKFKNILLKNFFLFQLIQPIKKVITAKSIKG